MFSLEPYLPLPAGECTPPPSPVPDSPPFTPPPSPRDVENLVAFEEAVATEHAKEYDPTWQEFLDWVKASEVSEPMDPIPMDETWEQPLEFDEEEPVQQPVSAYGRQLYQERQIRELDLLDKLFGEHELN